MIELIRDTVFGHFLRLISKGKIWPHEEDQDTSIWKHYIDTEKSGRMVHLGHTGEKEKWDAQDMNDHQQRIGENKFKRLLDYESAQPRDTS